MRQIIKNARKEADKTQKEIASLIGISERAYRKIKAGECKPNVETAISIARALGVQVEELFDTQTTKAAPIGRPSAKNQVTG